MKIKKGKEQGGFLLGFYYSGFMASAYGAG